MKLTTLLLFISLGGYGQANLDSILKVMEAKVIKGDSLRLVNRAGQFCNHPSDYVYTLNNYPTCSICGDVLPLQVPITTIWDLVPTGCYQDPCEYLRLIRDLERRVKELEDKLK